MWRIENSGSEYADVLSHTEKEVRKCSLKAVYSARFSTSDSDNPA